MTVRNFFQVDDAFPMTEIEKQVTGAQVLTLNTAALKQLMKEENRAMTLAIPNNNGGVYEVELARYDFFSHDFKMHLNHYNTLTEFNYTPGLYYSGVVKGVPGSVAAFTFFDNIVYGIFSLPGVGNIVVMENRTDASVSNSYLMYNDLNLKATPTAGCGTETLPSVKNMTPKAQNKNVYNTCKDVEIFLKADYDTYLDYGSNPQSFFTYIMSVYNMVATLYRNEAIYTSIKEIVINTSSDNYQWLSKSSHYYLYEFGDDVQNNIFGADLAMLVSTTSGNMGGVAWLNGLCASYSGSGGHGPYSFANIKGTWSGTSLPTYSWDIEVMTHEMGHNLGSPHTHSCGWPTPTGAIDACVPTQGGCPEPTPKYPSNGGTIMSYCHLASGVGINFANGFGPMPGDLIRDEVAIAPCATHYAPTSPVSSGPKTLFANRECTSEDGITYYWNDNNNLDETDDKIVVAIDHNGNNIGDLNDAGFEVKTATSLAYGSGTGVNLSFPAGTQNVESKNIAVNRYWSVKPTTQPTTSVFVYFPFIKTDIADANGTIPDSVLTSSKMRLYTVPGTVNPNPANGLAGATAGDVKIHKFGTAPTQTNWAPYNIADTVFAIFQTSTLGGGSAFYTYTPVSVKDVNSANNAIYFYPNPTSRNWNVWVPAENKNTVFRLFSVEGKLVLESKFESGTTNKVDASQLAPALYYYRISSEAASYNGTLQKQ